jgi:hypothetical protein
VQTAKHSGSDRRSPRGRGVRASSSCPLRARFKCPAYGGAIPSSGRQHVCAAAGSGGVVEGERPWAPSSARCGCDLPSRADRRRGSTRSVRGSGPSASAAAAQPAVATQPVCASGETVARSFLRQRPTLLARVARGRARCSRWVIDVPSASQTEHTIAPAAQLGR